MSDEQTETVVKRVCRHVTAGKREAVSTVMHTSIAGTTRADLSDETKLCLVCTGQLIKLLAELENTATPDEWWWWKGLPNER